MLHKNIGTQRFVRTLHQDFTNNKCKKKNDIKINRKVNF